MLKAKIQQRPPRQELERRHILEADPGHVDPSLAERQRMLKKARLADQLNDQLSHRPGPLELIQKNILHTEEPIEHAVKAGRIPYKATCEGQLNRPQLPHRYINPEDDSQSSEGDNASSSDVLETAAKSAGIVVSLIPATEGTVVVTTAAPVVNKDSSEIVFADLCRSVAAPLLPQTQASSPASLVSSTSTLSPLSSVASPVSSVTSQPATPAPPPMPVSLTPRPMQSPAKSDAPGKDKNRKKSKSKSAPKTRTIKFHEYKGPPSAQKSSSSNSGTTGESSYDLLLQQQTLLLQFQLQLQHKYPQIILPASQKNSEASTSNNNTTHQPSPSPSVSSTSSTSADAPSTSRLVGRLEDMKVSDLKAELKRRSLPVSGSKPQLIERLKPYTSSEVSMDTHSLDDSHSSPPPPPPPPPQQQQQQDSGSPKSLCLEEPQEQMELGNPLSPQPQNDQQRTQEDIVREQQKQIEELQRELTLSQLKLQAATRAEPKAQLLALQKHLQARQQQQQMVQLQQLQALQARQAQIDQAEQQRIQQQQHVAFQNQKNLAGGLLLNGADAALVLNQLVGKAKLVNGHARTHSLPNFLNSIVTPIISAPEIKTENEYSEDVKPPPPLYEEATKQIKKEKSNVKSQIVDDVLEILIKNGELPPSAANDPSTPGSAGTRSTEPVFPNTQQQRQVDPNSPEAALGLDPADLLDTLDTLENMDFSQLVMELGGQQSNENGVQNGEHESVPMDTDDWLDSLLPAENQNGNYTPSTAPLAPQEPDLGGYDPLLGIAQDPFDPFCLDEFRSPADLTASLSWDKVDFAA